LPNKEGFLWNFVIEGVKNSFKTRELIMSMNKGRENYNERLKAFLQEIEELAQIGDNKNPMHAIMDTVPFKDLEIALMMARMEQGMEMSNLRHSKAA
jgi:hypothetical protein